MLKIHDTFQINKSGYGIDLIWPEYISHLSKIAVVDATPVKHTRSKGPLYDQFKERGVDPESDFRAIVKGSPVSLTVGGCDVTGKTHHLWNGSHWPLVWLLVTGYLPEYGTKGRVVADSIVPVASLGFHWRDLTTMRAVRIGLCIQVL